MVTLRLVCGVGTGSSEGRYALIKEIILITLPEGTTHPKRITIQ